MKNGLARTNCLYSIGGLLLIGAFLALWLLFLPKPARASAGINQTINFQGRLLNNQGATVPDGFYNIEFKIYQDGDGQSVGDSTGSPSGSLKWTEDYLNSASHGVKVTNGYLSVNLGSITPFGSNIDWNQSTLWLSMQIGDTSSCTITTSFQTDCGGDGEMTPMQPMTSAPYALNSGELGGLTSSQYVQLAQGVQADSSTNVSIGVNKTGTSGTILELQKSGVDVMNVSNTGTVLFQPSADSTTALQVENHANSYAVFTVDTSNNQVILGKANSLSGKLAFATTGGGLITLSPTSTGSNFTITVPAETGTLCTTAASAACAAVYATSTGTVLLGPSSVQADSSNNNSIYINKTSGTGNILELQKSASDVFKIDNSGNVTSTGQNTLSRNSAGSNDYTLGVTGTPSATGSSSLIRIGSALTGGNGSLNGGTYLSIVEPSSSAGSAADFLNFQSGATPTVQLQLTSSGNLTVGGTYNGNTFDNAGHLTFGNSGAATISSNGSNNLTVDTGSSGGTEALGNNASTTNIGSSNAAHTINIGTGSGGTTTQAVTIGEATNSTSTLTLQGGNGTGAISLLTGNNGTAAGTIQIGNTSGAFNQTISIGDNNAAANTVNIGTGTGQDSVTLGDITTASSAVNIKAGSTGGITLGANTSLSANSNLTYASGSGKFDASNATGTFDTTTGANHLNGTTTVTGTNTFTVNGGATTLNGASAGSGTAAAVNTNATSNTGLVIQGVSSQTAALLQLQDSTGAALINADASGNIDEIGNFTTPYAGIGNYGNLLVQSEQLGTTWIASNINVTQNDSASNPAPDGNTTADKLVSTVSGTHTLTQTYSSAGNNTYTFSIWLKSANPPRPVQLRIDSNGTPGTGTAVSFNVLGNWQRYSVTQSFSSGVTTVTPTLVMVNNSSDIVGWGAQLVQSRSEGVYTRTGSSNVAAGSGLLDNQSAVFQALNNSATAYQFQNSSGVNVAAIDTSNGQLVLGTAGASGISGQIAFNYGGQTGNVTLQVANPGSSNYTVTLPAETGTICTTATVCSGYAASSAGGYVQLAPSSAQADSTNNNSIFINKTSGTGNILELQKSASDVFKIDNSGNLNSTGNVNNSGQNTLTRNSSGGNDYTLGVTGTPSPTGSSSLIRIGNALTGGNGAANGGTYLSIVEPAAIGATAGSAADFVNFQNGSTVELQLTSTGNLTVGGTYNGNTFDNAGHLTFGNSGAAVINSNGSNNLTVDTGSSGGTESLGNNASTTNIGSSNAAHTINIGTGSSGTTTQAITIGEATNSSSTLILQGGNGTGAVSLLTGNNGTTAGTIQIGNTSGAFNQTISIGNNNAAANTVNVGTGTGQDSVTIGDTTTASSAVTLKAGSTGGITLGANTSVSAGSNLTLASGSGKFDASNATGTFDTTTGTNHLNGNTTVTNSNTFTVNGGTTTLNGPTGGSSNAAKINTNAASNTGLVIQGASSQTAPLLQLQDSTNANLVTVDQNGNLEMIGYQDTPFGGFGNYSNLLLYSEQFDQSGTWAQSGITSVTANDGGSNPAPDGTTTADKITASSSGTHSLTQTYTTSTNGNYTFSVWVKTNSSSTGVQLRIDSTGASPLTGSAASFTATTTWQRFSVSQNFSGTPSNIKAVLLISSNNAVVAAWGGQLVTGLTSGVYARTVATNTVTAADGLINNGQSIFIDSVNSTTAYQFQNNSASDVLDVDTVNNRVGINLNNPNYALDVSGDINASSTLKTAGTTRIDSSGNLSNIAAITASGNINTTAGAFQIGGNSINSNGVLTNVAYLGQAQTFAGTNTFSASTINLNDSTIATNQSTITLLNATATNVTAFGAGTTIALGATTGTLTLENANITVGSAAGSAGTLTNNGATQYATDSLGDLAAGSIGTAASTVDIYTSFSIAPTASARAYTIPNPSASTAYGRAIYISNIGGSGDYFTINNIRIPPGSTGTLIWSNTNGGASWQFAGAGGASIENQNAADQVANFRINGTGQTSGSFQTPLLDTPSGTTTLAIGTTNATAINLNQNTTIAAGKLLVVGTNSTDLTCTNGGIYYNTSTNRFKGCENGNWITIDSFVSVTSSTSTSDTSWTIPQNASVIEVIAVGGGGGAGGAAARNGGQERDGGGGGGGGEYISKTFTAADLSGVSSTAHYVAGTAGSGGAGGASSGTAGSNGSAGTTTCFSQSANCGGQIYLEAFGGGGGAGGNQGNPPAANGGGGGGAGSVAAGGSATVNTGGSGGGPNGGAAGANASSTGGAGGGSGPTGGAGGGAAGGNAEYGGGGGGAAASGNAASGAGGSSVFGAGGGGAGASTNSGNSTGTAGAGGTSGSYSYAAGGGGSAGSGACPGGNGGAGSAGSSLRPGTGGGGGGANGGGGAAGCNGGTGGTPGGGGGGGGSGSATGGNGGNGGGGQIWILAW